MDTITTHFIAVHYESLSAENRGQVCIPISAPIFIKTEIDTITTPFVAVHYESLNAETRGQVCIPISAPIPSRAQTAQMPHLRALPDTMFVFIQTER